MQVTYNGFTGELVSLEKTICTPMLYDLSIYDREKMVTYSFTGVNPHEIKFPGGAVTFGG